MSEEINNQNFAGPDAVFEQVPEVKDPGLTVNKQLAPLPTNALFSLEPRTLQEVQSLAIVFAQSGFFDSVKTASQAMVKIMWGRQLGFGAVESMTGIHIIHEKPAVGAHMIAAGIRRNPRYDYEVIEHTDEICTIALMKDGKEFKRESFTIQQAAQAELTTGKNSHTWKKYPRNMLFARCIANIQKFHCPDVFSMTVYTPEEMGMEVDENGSPVIEGEFTYKPEAQAEPETRPTPQPDQKPRRDSKPAPQQKPEQTTEADPLDTPWQEHVKNWDAKRWQKYGIDMQDLGIPDDLRHAKLGGSAKDFKGTRRDHNNLILEIIEEIKNKPTEPTTQPGEPFDPPEDDDATESDPFFVGDEGYISCANVTLTAQGKDQRPLITIYAIDDQTGEDIQEAVIDRELTAGEAEELKEIIPAKISKRGTVIYDKTETPEDLWAFEWTRVPGKPEITITGFSQA